MVGIETAARDSDKLLVSDCPNPAHIAKQAAHQTLATVLIWLFISRSPLMLNILVHSNGQNLEHVLRMCFLGVLAQPALSLLIKAVTSPSDPNLTLRERAGVNDI